MARRLTSSWIAALCFSTVTDAVVFKRGESREELDERVARAQDKMAEYKLDALLLTTEANIRYFTGYHSAFWQSPTRPWFVVVPAQGKVTAVVPTIGKDCFERANTGSVILWPAPRPEDEGVSDLTRVIAKLPREHGGRLGAEMGTEMSLRMPLLDFFKLQKNLMGEGIDIVDGGDVVKLTRLVKSEAETEKVQATCEAISRAYRELPDVVVEGMTEAQACNQVKQLLLSQGVDDTAYVICRSGPTSYSDIIGHPTDRILQEGDMFIVDTGSQIDGYYADFNRNFAVGAPAQEVKDAYAKVYVATEAALRTVKPGVTFEDLYNSMAKVLEVKGEGGVGRMGHSIGLQLTEWPSIMAGSKTVLQEGMVLAIEPSVDLPSGGGRFIVSEEDIVVTKTGYRLLTERAPTTIPQIRRLQNLSLTLNLSTSIVNTTVAKADTISCDKTEGRFYCAGEDSP